MTSGDGSRLVQVHLNWADYNLWSPDGSAAPEIVARAALLVLLEHEEAAALPESFDAATLRRRYAGADEMIRARM